MRGKEHSRFFVFEGSEFRIERCEDGSAVGRIGHAQRRGEPLVSEHYAAKRTWKLYEREVVDGSRRRAWIEASHTFLPNAATFDDALRRFMGADAAKILIACGSLDT